MEEKQELWDQLDAETSRAYDAFKCYYSLPRKERDIVSAYRIFSGNTTSTQPRGNFSKWAQDFAWEERARARDAHLDRVHLRGLESAIEDAAKDEYQAAQQVRGRTYELLTAAYQKALEHFENVEWNDFPTRDAVAIIKIHLEATKELAAQKENAQNPLDDWNEEDDRELDAAVEELRAEAAKRDVAQANSADKKEDS